MIKDYKRFNQRIPDSLIAPDLHDIEWLYWNAFWELGTDRQVGMEKGPIPWSSIERFIAKHPGCDFGVFSSIIREMDGAYLSHQGGESRTFTREMMRG